MADQLVFTTEFTLSAGPSVNFSPAGRGLGLMNSSLTGKVDRKDMHTVTIALALDDTDKKLKTEVDSVRTDAERLTAAEGGRTIVGRLLTASVRTRAGRLAVEAANQLLTQQVFKPTLQLTP